LTNNRKIDCPVCGTSMNIHMRGRVEIDQCVNCGGIWLDKGELTELAGVRPSQKRIVVCPLCDKDMSLMRMKGVDIDYCSSCKGVWLDRGELKALSTPGVDQLKAWLEVRRNVDVARAPVAEMSKDFLDEVFVMVDGGILVASCVNKKSAAVDEDILAGMLTAIQDFVKTAFTPVYNMELKAIQFGERNILMERGDQLMMAAVVSGDAAMVKKCRQELKEGILEIERHYGKDLDNWDGSIDSLKGLRGAVARIFS